MAYSSSPSAPYSPHLPSLRSAVAIAAFVALLDQEKRIWPLGQLIHQFINAFTDHCDSDLLILSHFSLLLGCAFPIWMSSRFNDRPLAPFVGILSLGIGDTMARFLLAKLNPSATYSNANEIAVGSGVIFTDDVSLQVFIEYLQRLVVQY